MNRKMRVLLIVVCVLIAIISLIFYRNRSTQSHVQQFCNEFNVGDSIERVYKIINEHADKYDAKKFIKHKTKDSDSNDSYSYFSYAFNVNNTPFCQLITKSKDTKIYAIQFTIGDKVIYKKEAN